MIKKMGYRWRLRDLMADQQMFKTTDLIPHLVERGITLSREQVFRLVTQPPQRLSMDTLVALCDILGCTPNDLIVLEVVNKPVRKTAGAGGGVVRRRSRPEKQSYDGLASHDTATLDGADRARARVFGVVGDQRCRFGHDPAASTAAASGSQRMVHGQRPAPSRISRRESGRLHRAHS